MPILESKPRQKRQANHGMHRSKLYRVRTK